MRRTGRILTLAVASRLLVLSLMVISDAAFKDLDTSAHLQNRPCDFECRANATDRNASACDGGDLATSMIDELAPWDSVFFVRIAKCGYENDMNNAFFPLVPMIMRVGSRALGLSLLQPWLPIESSYTLVALFFSIMAFSIAALSLYKLTMQVIGDELIALTSVVLFCFNPASVFYSAAYTESAFAAATWTAALLLRGADPAGGVLALAVASATRSNGVLGAWFAIHGAASAAFSRRAALPHATALAAAATAAAFLPYVLMQIKGYRAFCGNSDVGEVPHPPWCNAPIPAMYGYVQRVYWNVGFLRFYHKFNRIPKILESAPILALSIAGCFSWWSHDWHRAISLGIFPVKLGRTGAGVAPPSLDAASPFLAPPFSAPTSQAPSVAPEAISPNVGVPGTRLAARPRLAALRAPRGSVIGASPTSPLSSGGGEPALSPLGPLSPRGGVGTASGGPRRVQPPPGRAFACAAAAAPYVHHWALMTATALLVMHVNVATRFLSVCPPLYWYSAGLVLTRPRIATAMTLWAFLFIGLGCLLFPNFYPWT